MLGARYRYSTNVTISIVIIAAISITIFAITWPYPKTSFDQGKNFTPTPFLGSG